MAAPGLPGGDHVLPGRPSSGPGPSATGTRSPTTPWARSSARLLFDNGRPHPVPGPLVLQRRGRPPTTSTARSRSRIAASGSSEPSGPVARAGHGTRNPYRVSRSGPPASPGGPGTFDRRCPAAPSARLTVRALPRSTGASPALRAGRGRARRGGSGRRRGRHAGRARGDRPSPGGPPPRRGPRSRRGWPGARQIRARGRPAGAWPGGAPGASRRSASRA